MSRPAAPSAPVSPRPHAAPAPHEDAALVREVLNGHPERFEALVLRHQKPLYSYVLRIVGRPDEAVEVAQEAFARAYLALDRYDARWRFSTWLYRIATNCAIDVLRRGRPAPVSLDESLPGGAPGLSERIASTSASPAEAFEFRETSARLSRALAKLSPPARALLLLRHVHHRRYDEIARITGLPLGTVKNRIFRSRERLRRLLDAPPRRARKAPRQEVWQ